MNLTTRDHLLTILQTRTQAEAAEDIGISERTIRRIKNDPNHKVTPEVAAKIEKLGKRERKKLLTVTEKELIKKARKIIKKSRIKSSLPDNPRGDWMYEIPDLPIIPVSHRETRIDPRDNTLKTRMWSDAISFDVSKLSTADIKKLVLYYRDKGLGEYSFQFVFWKSGYESGLFDPEVDEIAPGPATLGGTSPLDIGGIKMHPRTKWSDKRVDERLQRIQNSLVTKPGKKQRQNIKFLRIQKMS